MPGIFHTITSEDVSKWPPPNYDHPTEDRMWLAPFAIFWAVLSTVFVGGRLILRVRNRSGSFGSDDVFIFIGWAFSIGFTATACIATWTDNIGVHVWDFSPKHFTGGLHTGWVAQVLFIHSTCATKVSVLLFYHRMVKDTYSRGWLYTVWILLFITIGSWIGIFVSYCFMCRPLSAFWFAYTMEAHGITEYSCINGDALTIAVGVLTIASDFWTAAFPCTLFQYHDLGATRQQKTALNTIFCLGFLVTGVGIARTYYLWEIAHKDDVTWIGYDLFTVSVVELQLSLICTCAPFLRAILRRFADKVSTARSRNDTAASGSRITVRQAGARSSFVVTTPLTPIHHRAYSPFNHVEEKQGYLIKEESTGRMIWSSKGQGRDTHSPTSAMFATEPLSPVEC